MNEQALIRLILDKAAETEQHLEQTAPGASWWREEVAYLYRTGFRRAQQVSAQFYEDCAAAYGFSTPLAREAWNLEPMPGADIEDLELEEWDLETRPERRIETVFPPMEL